MAILAAVNYDDKLVLLEDGREMAITAFYNSDNEEVEDYRDAHHFNVVVPHSGDPAVVLIFDIEAIATTKPSEVN